jgi:hypothetical protein
MSVLTGKGVRRFAEPGRDDARAHVGETGNVPYSIDVVITLP